MNNLLSKITPILEWLKTNPLLMFCGLIILLSGFSFYWPTHVYNDAFRAEAEARDKESHQIEVFFKSPAELPPDQPDDPPRSIKMVVKSEATRRISDIYDQLKGQHNDIFRFAVETNRGNHSLLVDGLFPEPGEDDQMVPYTGREAYIKSFARLYELLNAGTPPDAEEIKGLLDREEATYRGNHTVAQGVPLTDTQTTELTRQQAKVLLEFYQETAKKRHVYAESVILRTSGASPVWKPGPFQVADWAKQGKKPLQAELWSGQMDLWIQQDICSAIMIANHINDPSASLVDQPVKQLISIKVSPLYIGLPKQPPVPPGKLLPPLPEDTIIKDQLNKRLVDNFELSPTGRVTNYLYDVRRASLSVIVESRKIPEFLNALGKVNFTTIVGMAMKDVDEFSAFRRGYWYGEVDVVQLDLELESIWLRSWTAGHLSKDDAKASTEKENRGYMPESVRVFLGLKPWDTELYEKTLIKNAPTSGSR